MALFGTQLVVRRGPPGPATAGAAAAAAGAAAAGAKKGTGDINLDNILKLIPADVVAIYLAAKGVQVDPIVGVPWLQVLFWACLIVCAVLRLKATAPVSGGQPNWIFVLVTCVAFFIWAHAIADKPEAAPIIGSFYGTGAGIIAMLFALLAPVLVPAEPRP